MRIIFSHHVPMQTPPYEIAYVHVTNEIWLRRNETQRYKHDVDHCQLKSLDYTVKMQVTYASTQFSL